MKFYKLTYDMDSIDKLSKEEKNFIYAEESNLKEIECAGEKKGFFIILFLIDWNLLTGLRLNFIIVL